MASGSAPATPFLYAAIAHNDVVLAEHTTTAAGKAANLAAIVLPDIDHSKPQKLTCELKDDYLHYIADPSSAAGEEVVGPNLTYLVVAKKDLGQRIPFGFLIEVKKRFLSTYPPVKTDFASLPAYGAAAFNGTLRSLMHEYGTTRAGKDDAIANVRAELDNVRGIMTENIERVLERGEHISLLVDKTDRLGGSASDFRVRSRVLRRKMWWKNARLMVMLTLAIVFLVYLFVGFGCGLPTWSHCVHHD